MGDRIFVAGARYFGDIGDKPHLEFERTGAVTTKRVRGVRRRYVGGMV